MDLEIEIWSEDLVDGHQTIPYQPGALFWGSLVVFPTHFNPNSSLFKITSNFIPIRIYPRVKRETLYDGLQAIFISAKQLGCLV